MTGLSRRACGTIQRGTSWGQRLEPAWLWATPRTEEAPSRGAGVLHGCWGETPLVEQGGCKVTDHAVTDCGPVRSPGRESPRSRAGTPAIASRRLGHYGADDAAQSARGEVLEALCIAVDGCEGMSRTPAVEVGEQAPRLLRGRARVPLCDNGGTKASKSVRTGPVDNRCQTAGLGQNRWRSCCSSGMDRLTRPSRHAESCGVIPPEEDRTRFDSLDLLPLIAPTLGMSRYSGLWR